MLSSSPNADSELASAISAAGGDGMTLRSPESGSTTPSPDLVFAIGEVDVAPSFAPVSACSVTGLADGEPGLVGSEDSDEDDDEDDDDGAGALDLAELLRKAGIETRGKLTAPTHVSKNPRKPTDSTPKDKPQTDADIAKEAPTERKGIRSAVQAAFKRPKQRVPPV